MARIRTIKPELFTHEELFEAEQETGLPLRLAYAGLFTCCDREGRFKWRPRELKLAVLPFDDLDFSRVLDALMTRGFLVRYQSCGESFGHVPTWKKHQFVNNRESASIIPEPPFNQGVDASSTRDDRDDHETGTRLEGKGKERKGKIIDASITGDAEVCGITKHMIAKTVTGEIKVTSDKVLIAVSDQAQLEIGIGDTDEDTANAIAARMVSAWRSFREHALAENLEWECGAEKFFADGYWRDLNGMLPFKEGRRPRPRLVVSDVPIHEFRSNAIAVNSMLGGHAQ